MAFEVLRDGACEAASERVRGVRREKRLLAGKQQRLQCGQSLHGGALAGERSGGQQLLVPAGQELTDLTRAGAVDIRPEGEPLVAALLGHRAEA